METVIIVVHLMVVVALVAVVLLQRSEGGALGMGGGGGGGGGFMSARGAANALTRTTGFLAFAFFATSLTLGVMAKYGADSTSILDRIPTTTEDGSGGGILDQLRPEGAPTGTNSDEPQVPTSQ